MGEDKEEEEEKEKEGDEEEVQDNRKDGKILTFLFVLFAPFNGWH